MLGCALSPETAIKLSIAWLSCESTSSAIMELFSISPIDGAIKNEYWTPRPFKSDS